MNEDVVAVVIIADKQVILFFKEYCNFVHSIKLVLVGLEIDKS